MTDKEKSIRHAEEEKTSVVGLSLLGAQAMDGNPANIDVKDGKIIRIRPLHYDWKYKPEDFRPWKIEARGKSFEPRMQSLLHGDRQLRDSRTIVGIPRRRDRANRMPFDQAVREDHEEVHYEARDTRRGDEEVMPSK